MLCWRTGSFLLAFAFLSQQRVLLEMWFSGTCFSFHQYWNAEFKCFLSSFSWTCVLSGCALWMLNKILLKKQRGLHRRPKRQRCSFLEKTQETGNHRGLSEPTAVPHLVCLPPFSMDNPVASPCQGERWSQLVSMSPESKADAWESLPSVATCPAFLFWNPGAWFCRKQGETTGNILSVGGLLGGLTACLIAVSLGEWRGEERRGGLSPLSVRCGADTPAPGPALSRQTFAVTAAWGWTPAPKTEGTSCEQGQSPLAIPVSLFCSPSTYPSCPAPPPCTVHLGSVSANKRPHLLPAAPSSDSLVSAEVVKVDVGNSLKALV